MTATCIAFLCGSLITCTVFLLITGRRQRLDERLIRRLRRNSYLRGWRDGRSAGYTDL